MWIYAHNYCHCIEILCSMINFYILTLYSMALLSLLIIYGSSLKILVHFLWKHSLSVNDNFVFSFQFPHISSACFIILSRTPGVIFLNRSDRRRFLRVSFQISGEAFKIKNDICSWVWWGIPLISALTQADIWVLLQPGTQWDSVSKQNTLCQPKENYFLFLVSTQNSWFFKNLEF